MKAKMTRINNPLFAGMGKNIFVYRYPNNKVIFSVSWPGGAKVFEKWVDVLHYMGIY